MTKTKNTYITRLLAFLVLTVLHDLGMRAEHVDDVGATKLTGKVKRGFKALEHQDRRSVTDSVGGGVIAGSECLARPGNNNSQPCREC